MDALLITDVSARTAIILFVTMAVLFSFVMTALLITFRCVIKLTVERIVVRTMAQSKTNYETICKQGKALKEQGDAIKALQEQMDRIEQAMNQQGHR